MECPFCEIDEERTRIFYNGKKTYVLFSSPRLMPGHLLVIPKRHVVRPSELNFEERDELFVNLFNYQEKIIENISTGCDIRQNYRPFQKDGEIKQNHLHFHLLPRNNFDELYDKCQRYETNIFQKLEKEELERMEKLLK